MKRYSKTTQNTQTFTIHDIDTKEVMAEENFVIDCIYSGEWDDELELMSPDMFVHTTNGQLFGYACDLHRNNIPVSPESINTGGYILSEEERERLSVIECNKSAHIKYNVKLLKRWYVMRCAFQIGGAVNSMFNGDEDVDAFLDVFSRLASPLVNLAKRVENQYQKDFGESRKEMSNCFTPHYIVKGNERYRVCQSKFDPSKGYVWVNTKAVPEQKMLQNGFVIEELTPHNQ